MTRDQRIERFLSSIREGFLICDGAMGTTLAASGHAAGAALEALNVDRPDVVREAHRAYVEAGAQIVTTNTFQGARPALERHGLGERTAVLNAAGARVAREAAGEAVFVAGNIGPSGLILEPYGDYPAEEARVAFAEQAQALADGGADLLIVETFSSVEEAVAAVGGASEVGLPVVASMAFDPSGRTAFGVRPEQAAEAMAAAGAVAVGANCGTVSSAEIVDILAAFRSATSLPLIAQPNAGRPQRTDQGAVYPETPETMAESAARLRELGVAIIGACCGSTAAHIRALATKLRAV